MKRWLARIAVAMLLVLVVSGIITYTWLYPNRGPKMAIDPHEKGYVEEINGTRVLHLKGSPYEMGYQRGALVKDLLLLSERKIDELLDDAKEHVGLPKTAANLILDTVYALCSPHIPTRYKREMEGVADGSGVDLQLLRRIHVISVVTERGCSAFTAFGKATKNGDLYHGRNFDWITEAGLQDTAILVCCEPDGYHPFASVGYAAFTSVLTGINMEGISISQIGAITNDKQFSGTPLAYILRRILEETDDLDDATEILQNARRTVGYNYVIGDGDAKAARAFETTAHHCAVFTDNDPNETAEYAIPIDDAVFRSDEAMDPTVRSLQNCANAPDLPYGSESYDHRYKGIATDIQENYGQIDDNIALNILKDAAMRKASLHCALYNSTTREIWVAHAGSPELGKDAFAYKQPFVYYDLKKLFSQPHPNAKEKQQP